MNPARSLLAYLECPECGEERDASIPQSFCEKCNSPLLARYDLESARAILRKSDIRHRPPGMWRWRELMPVKNSENIVSLGEGDTPILRAHRLGTSLGLEHLYIKDESLQPTGTFKARGLSSAVSMAKELSLPDLVIPTAGNAGGALSAYATRAGISSHVYMPEDAPRGNIEEVRAYGGGLEMVSGPIDIAAQAAKRAADKHGWFNVSTFREPYRLEGKKTMGLEIAEAFEWNLPDVVVYPTGGGTGLVGIWKAFDELERLGWINPGQRPKMVTVQAAGCAPIVRAFQNGREEASVWEAPETLAAGLRVPFPFAHRIILRVLRNSNGIALSVTDEEIVDAQQSLARREGIFAAPEGAATVAAASTLIESGWLDPESRTLLCNTGSGLKYIC